MSNILDIEFSNWTLSETTVHISNILDNTFENTYHIMTVNSEIGMKILSNTELKQIADKANLITPDGMGIIWASKLLNGQLTERVTGYDLIWSIFNKNKNKPLRIYLVGSSHSTIHQAEEILKKNFPNYIFRSHNGYFNTEEEAEVVNDINQFAPDLLLAGLGSPKQDYFIHANKEKLNAKVAIGVGGSFEVISGKEKRAPLIFQKSGLEWAYRILSNPTRFKKFKYIFSFGLKAMSAAIKPVQDTENKSV